MIADYLEAVAAVIGCSVTFSDGEYALPLLKTLKCQPALDGKEPLEQLIQYLELCHMLLKNQCFVLVGTHTGFSREELGNFITWKIIKMAPSAAGTVYNSTIARRKGLPFGPGSLRAAS